MPEMGVDEFDRVIIHDGAGNYLKVPRLTTTQRDALTAAEGLIIFNTTTNQVEVCIDTTWRSINYTALASHEADHDAHMFSLHDLMRVAQYIMPVPAAEISDTTLAADRIYALPFVVARNITIDQLAIDLTTGSNTDKCRMGIYEDGTDLYPGALVKDYGQADVEVADQGIVAIAADQALTKGLYWLVVVSDAGISCRYLQPAWTGLGMYHGAGNFQYRAAQWYKDAVGIGALADPFESGATLYRARVPMVCPRLKTLD